ncbi:MAG TPA: DNA-3-methyladenine glycosylase [Candidatus Saccharimonadales bacterium]|nr:DNA-3-methyladenine glycosylase [Candidatus Saccharimonadales bacterium]
MSGPDLSDALTAAPALLGWELIHDSPDGRTGGIIVETEAYTAEDAASHSFRGRGVRNDVMFGPAGHIYVYFTYGMHYCINIVTGGEGRGEAVLIRALEPTQGLELMRSRRLRARGDISLTNGPAKLTQALAINKTHNGVFLLNKGSLRLVPGSKPERIIQTTRIGISRAVETPWRFYIANNPFVSKP